MTRPDRQPGGCWQPPGTTQQQNLLSCIDAGLSHHGVTGVVCVALLDGRSHDVQPVSGDWRDKVKAARKEERRAKKAAKAPQSGVL